MDKLVKDGKVAVLYSPGFGSGWSTNFRDGAERIFDPILAGLVLAGASKEEIRAHAANKYSGHRGGLDTLRVEWILQGAKFRICEYDGSEYIEVEYADFWTVA